MLYSLLCLSVFTHRISLHFISAVAQIHATSEAGERNVVLHVVMKMFDACCIKVFTQHITDTKYSVKKNKITFTGNPWAVCLLTI